MRGVAREVAQVLAHLGGPVAQLSPMKSMPSGSRAVSAAPISVPSSMVPVVSTVTWHEQRYVGAGRRDRPAGAVDRGLGLQQVLGGLDQHRVGAAVDHAAGLRLVGVAQLGVGRVAQRRELGARPDRADHPARVVRGRALVDHVAGDARAGLGELLDAVLDAVFGEVGEVGAEGVGLDAVDADVEVGLVHRADDVDPADAEDLVAALVALVVVEAGALAVVGGLQHRAHGAVGDHDALGQGRSQGLGRVAHRGHSRSRPRRRLTKSAP